MFFNVIAEKKGVSSLMAVYTLMYADKIDFFRAVEKKLFWDQKKLSQEIKKELGL